MTFLKLDALNDHKEKHTEREKSRKCKQCDFVCRNSSGLKIHMKNHSGEHPFLCGQCTKTFKNLENLKIHKRIHKNSQAHGQFK